MWARYQSEQPKVLAPGEKIHIRTLGLEACISLDVICTVLTAGLADCVAGTIVLGYM
jgi:hypothetical protein